MDDLANALSISASGMRAQAARLRVVTENVANTDTPGFRRKLLTFQEFTDRASGLELVEAGRVGLDRTERERVFDPSHPLADASGHYTGSNVNAIVEIADAREAQRSFEANLRMFDQARQMARSALDLLKR